MTFHLANRVAVRKRGERGGVSGQRTALRGLSEVEEFAGEGARAINRQAVSQIRPFVRFLVAQFEREFPPLSRSFRRRPRNTRRHFRRTDRGHRIFLSGSLEKRRQGVCCRIREAAGPVCPRRVLASCHPRIRPTLGGGGAGDRDDPEERPLPVALLPNHLCQHRLMRCDAEQRDAWR